MSGPQTRSAAGPDDVRLRQLPPQDLAQSRGIEAGIGVDHAVARAIGAERSVARSTVVSRSVTVGARIVVNSIVQCDPVGVEMRSRLRTVADLEVRHQILAADHDRRNGVADVAFEADGLRGGVQVLPVVTADSLESIDVPHIVSDACPQLSSCSLNMLTE